MMQVPVSPPWSPVRLWRLALRAAAGLALSGLPGLAAPALAQADPLANTVRAELLAEHDAVAPGTPITLGIHLQHAPHWHTYWIVPGDAGLPTQMRWTLEPGYSAGPILWPAPQRLRVGALANYGYEGDLLLPVVVTVPAAARPGSTVRFAGHADWLVCNDLCIPGGADLAITLPVRVAADVHPGPEAGRFEATRRLIPGPITLKAGRAGLDAGRVRLEFAAPSPVARTLEFFPLEGGRIVASADQALTRVSGGRLRLELQAETPATPGFTSLRGVLVADGGPAAGGWTGQIDLPLQGAGPTGAAPAARNGTSEPPAGAPPAGAAAPAPALPTAPPPAAGAAPPPAAPGAAMPAVPAPSSAGAALGSSLLALAGAFLGGLILNLMPCVFPVLSLKLIALVQHRGETRARLRGHGLAFTAGVVLSFLALAGLLLVLRSAGSQIGWGFQLQSPLVVAGLIALFFLIGLNLLGVFDFTAGAGLANSRAARALDGDAGPGSDGGLRGSFATGVLASVVASPCTAPFMGAALGYAVTQSAPAALLVFAALGLGMATPYLALTFFPSGLHRLPRPGVWMERLKQLMAFPMFLTCVWLFWVIAMQLGADAVAWVLVALVSLGLAAWALGLAQRGARAFRWLAAAAAIGTALTLVPLARGTAPPAAMAARADASGTWSAWSPAAQGAALATGRPVFVDFTAAWCITCQVNRRVVLDDARVVDALHSGGVVLMEADWTRRDEAISRELTRFARSGVPMYVLYDRAGTPHLLPEILSTQGMLDALAALK